MDLVVYGIVPYEATNKTITLSSSDDSIATAEVANIYRKGSFLIH